jgi:glutamyl-tRNA synthetase
MLGWSPGGDKERMSIGEMVQLFSLERVGQANAKFNREKLLAFNTESLAAEGATQLLPAMRDFLAINPDSPLNNATAAQLEKVIEMNAGMHTLREAELKSRFLFLPDEAIQYSPPDVEKILLKNDRQGLAAIAKIHDVLANVADWNADALEAAVKSHCETTGLSLGKVAQPIRLAISGSAVSPPIFASLAVLGPKSTLHRIQRCLKAVGESIGPAPAGP